MNAGWLTVLALGAGLLGASFGELVSQEIRTRLDRIPQAVIRLAALRLPVDLRAECTDEWLAELHEILRGKDALPITRILIGTHYALSLARSSPAIGRELTQKPTGPDASKPSSLTAPVRNTRRLTRNLPTNIKYFPFSGRSVEMAQIERLVRASTAVPGRKMTMVIQGIAGSGKTALALHAARRLIDQFPDGQLFVDLRGSGLSGSPLSPADALGALLGQLGVPPQAIPTTMEERAALYRRRLTGTKTLVLLDSVKSEAQIELLLDITPDCLVLVTSRHSLTGLDDTEVIMLDRMSPADAVTLFTAAVGPGHVSATDPKVAELTAACGNLPLALSILAGYLRARPNMPVGALADRLRLPGVLHGHDGSVGVETALQIAYRELSSAERSFLRNLGNHPGVEIDADTASAHTGLPRQVAATLLASLHTRGLLMESASGCYGMHDLIGLYVQVLIEACRPERDDCV